MKLGGAGAETTDERRIHKRQNPGLQCIQVKQLKRETLAGNGIVMARAGSTAREASGSIRTVQGQLQSPSGEAQHYGIARTTMPEQNPNSRSPRVKAARTPPPQQQSRVQDSASRSDEMGDSGASETTYTELNESRRGLEF